MFEAVVAAEEAGVRPTAANASKKLLKNKNTLSAAATADDLRRVARARFEEGVPMTADQMRLARNKGALGGARRPSIGRVGWVVAECSVPAKVCCWCLVPGLW